MRHVAHDLNNHITAVLSFSDLVLDEMPPTHALRSRIEAIRTIGFGAVIKSLPNATRIAQVAADIAQLRHLAFSALADVIDIKSGLHADLLEIATAAEQASALLSDVDVRTAA
jgi:hypothetical protein